MTRKKLRNIYQYSTLAVLTVIIIPLETYLHWDLKWYYFILIYAIAMTIGGFLYLYFSGVNVRSVQFIGDNDISHQDFTLEFQLGFSPYYLLNGYFDNSLGLKEEDLAQLVYTIATKQMLYPSLKYGTPETLILPYKNQNITLYLG